MTDPLHRRRQQGARAGEVQGIVHTIEALGCHPQSLSPKNFNEMMTRIRRFADAAGRKL